MQPANAFPTNSTEESAWLPDPARDPAHRPARVKVKPGGETILEGVAYEHMGMGVEEEVEDEPRVVIEGSVARMAW